MTTLAGKEDTYYYHLLQLKHGLKLEINGLKNSRGSVYAHIKKLFGYKGNKEKVLAQLERYIANWLTAPTCDYCGSRDVVFDAWAEYDPEEGRMVLNDVFQQAFCQKCDGETTVSYGSLQPKGLN